jgi:hypothetical protein
MKQVFLFALIMPMLCSAIFCDEIVYVVTQDSVLDRISGGVAARVSEGERVFSQGKIRGNIGVGINPVFEILVKTEQGQEGWIQANHILLENNQPLFDSVSAKRWIFSYYQDIIFERRRDSLYKYEPFWRDDYDDTVKGTWIEGDPWWWRFYPTDFYIRDNFIDIDNILCLDNIDFVTTKQEQNNTAILIQCICTHKSNFLPQTYWNTISNEGETYKFIFKTDGDYMDVFLDDNPVKICTLIGVDDYFVNGIVGIVKEEYVDLTRITWPRRADGSMDYPPPVDMTNYTATHRTLDNLHLRDTANTSAKLVTTLPKGTEVQLIETGPATTIDGISAYWVKVISGNGYTGWCFSGYLEEIKKPDIVNRVIESQGPDIGVAGVNQGNELILHDNKQRFMPLWALIAIIGGAVVLAGGVVFFIVKRKKTN